VFEAIRDKAKTGTPQAAAELLAWLTRLPQAPGSACVTIPTEIDAVIEALRQEAAKGNPAAAREYRAWLSEFGEQQASDADLEIVALDDMTPAQRQFALAWAERQVARAAGHYQGLHRASILAKARSSLDSDEGPLVGDADE
jgi:hypothetical protein